MPEIQEIIAATDAAYRRFAAGRPDKDTRDAVNRVVRFLIVDLESINSLTSTAGGV